MLWGLLSSPLCRPKATTHGHLLFFLTLAPLLSRPTTAPTLHQGLSTLEPTTSRPWPLGLFAQVLGEESSLAQRNNKTGFPQARDPSWPFLAGQVSLRRDCGSRASLSQRGKLNVAGNLTGIFATNVKRNQKYKGFYCFV